MVYTKEFKEKAVDLAGRIGVIGACRETGVCPATMRKWRRKAGEIIAESENVTECAAESVNQSVNSTDPLAGLPREIRSEWEEMRKLNESCRQTIAMLAEENVVLRQQCEDYLRAIALIAGNR